MSHPFGRALISAPRSGQAAHWRGSVRRRALLGLGLAASAAASVLVLSAYVLAALHGLAPLLGGAS